MYGESSDVISRIQWFPQRHSRKSLAQLPIVQEALARWPAIRGVVAKALMDAGVEADYGEGFAITGYWHGVQLPEGDSGRAITIGFDGGQYLGTILVHFSDWRLDSIEVDHTGDCFCPLSAKHQ